MTATHPGQVVCQDQQPGLNKQAEEVSLLCQVGFRSMIMSVYSCEVLRLTAIRGDQEDILTKQDGLILLALLNSQVCELFLFQAQRLVRKH